jgi:hypothetical protein
VLLIASVKRPLISVASSAPSLRSRTLTVRLSAARLVSRLSPSSPGRNLLPPEISRESAGTAAYLGIGFRRSRVGRKRPGGRKVVGYARELTSEPVPEPRGFHLSRLRTPGSGSGVLPLTRLGKVPLPQRSKLGRARLRSNPLRPHFRSDRPMKGEGWVHVRWNLRFLGDPSVAQGVVEGLRGLL